MSDARSSRATQRIEGAIGTNDFALIALRTMARECSVDAMAMLHHSSHDSPIVLVQPGLSASEHEMYARDFAQLNPFVTATNALRIGEVTRTASCLPIRQYRQLPYFGWAQQTFGAYELAAVASRPGSDTIVVTFGQKLSRGDSTPKLAAYAHSLVRFGAPTFCIAGCVEATSDPTDTSTCLN